MKVFSVFRIFKITVGESLFKGYCHIVKSIYFIMLQDKKAEGYFTGDLHQKTRIYESILMLQGCQDKILKFERIYYLESFTKAMINKL